MASSSTVNGISKTRGTVGLDYFPVLASERLDIALCRASAKVAREADAQIGTREMGVGEHLVLKMLAAVGPCCQRELSEGLRIDRSMMVGCVDALEEAGFAKRQRSDRDRRAYAVTITDAGREALSGAERDVPGFLDEAFGALSRAERVTLGDLLGKLLAEPSSD